MLCRCYAYHVLHSQLGLRTCSQILPPATNILQTLSDSNTLAYAFLTNLAISKHKPLHNLRQGERKEVRVGGRESLGLGISDPHCHSLTPAERQRNEDIAEGMLFSCGGAQHLLGSREAHAKAGITNLSLASPEPFMDLAGLSQSTPQVHPGPQALCSSPALCTSSPV